MPTAAASFMAARWLFDHPEPAFALAFLGMVYFNRRPSVARGWAAVLVVEWLLSALLPWLMPYDLRLQVGLWSDFILALMALFSFTLTGAPWWVLALSLTWIAQIWVHYDMADDGAAMSVRLNVLCAAQIALVCSDRVGNAIGAWIDCVTRTLRYSNGGLAAASRHCTRALGGPDCRSAVLRRVRRQVEGRREKANPII